ncbi:VOC family protein [uncultured Proteiniphilum sp.]|uniref:VOC family protein n=1 Tax=uncultured Proteiniphilum sp. TaxID=497637 RepID=UPI00261EE6A1|nr:VOC family protein [uncultured Proteiniphilum sp.]
MEYLSLSPNIGVRNVEETVQFYTEALGFKLIMSVPSPRGGLQWAMVAGGGATIMFQKRENLTEEYPQLGKRPILGAITFYVKMKGMQELYDKLQATEYIALKMHKTFYGTDEFAIFDNNGHILTITEDKE